MVLTSLEKNVLLTLAYSTQFEQPLTTQQLQTRLLATKVISGNQQFKQVISSLLNKNLITQDRNYLSLKTQPIKREKLKTKIENSQKKIKEAQPLVKVLRNLPWIKAILITGSVAVENAVENDDTDFLIITSKNRLWLVRPVVILVAALFGKRRTADGNHRDNSWCFNLFLEENSLKMPLKQHNVYTAYEVLQANFIYDAVGTEHDWLQQNKWVKNVLPNFYDQRWESLSSVGKVPKIKTFMKFNWLWNPLNYLFFKLQFWYMQPRITREKVGLSSAFFHPRDTHGWIGNRWKNEILKLLEQV